MNTVLTFPDYLALAWFIGVWWGFSFVLDHTPLGRKSLSFAMDKQRALWMQAMMMRDNRIVDTSIMTGLQQGTAFFASTALLAIGGTFTLISATEDALTVFHHLPFSVEMTGSEWELKMLVLMLVYIYVFFKFGWAYRLFNYASMLIGAVPKINDTNTQQTRHAVHKATQMTILAGRHFNRGLRGFFLALGILGWFISATVFMMTTSFVVIVLIRRQFFSASRKAVLMPDQSE